MSFVRQWWDRSLVNYFTLRRLASAILNFWRRRTTWHIKVLYKSLTSLFDKIGWSVMAVWDGVPHALNISLVKKNKTQHNLYVPNLISDNIFTLCKTASTVGYLYGVSLISTTWKTFLYALRTYFIDRQVISNWIWVNII